MVDRPPRHRSLDLNAIATLISRLTVQRVVPIRPGGLGTARVAGFAACTPAGARASVPAGPTGGVAAAVAQILRILRRMRQVGLPQTIPPRASQGVPITRRALRGAATDRPKPPRRAARPFCVPAPLTDAAPITMATRRPPVRRTGRLERCLQRDNHR